MVIIVHTLAVRTITNILSQNKSLEIFALFFFVCSYMMFVKNILSEIVKVMISRRESLLSRSYSVLSLRVQHCFFIQLIAIALNPKSTLLNLTEFHKLISCKTYSVH